MLELGLVLVVLSLLVSGLLTVATQNIRLAKKKELEMKMDAIEEAVLSYRRMHGFIPCPGDITLVETAQNFGFQAVNPGSCQDGTGGALSPDIDAAWVSSNTAAGAVPVRTLGLPDDYARDPWGAKFFYVVDIRATAASTFAVSKLTNTSLIGSITVKDASDNTITSTAVMLLMSFGPNGHGSYVTSSRKFTGSINDQEHDNCTCDDVGGTGSFDSVFYAHPASGSSSGALDSFDDVARFYSRAKLSSDEDTATEK